MEAGQASRTAEHVAAHRAAHQVVDRPLVFEDPLALEVIAPETAEVLRSTPATIATPMTTFLRAFVSVRSRIAEDTLRGAVERGVRQYVVLGAGLDTFAYRNSYPGLHVFEIDHPDTQALKRERLAGAGIEMPPSATLFAADLRTMSVTDALAQAGVDLRQPVWCAWLGVVMYLDLAAVQRTLAALGACAAGSGVVLDYALPPASVPFVPRLFYKRVLQRVAKMGEPWRTFFEPAAMTRELQQAGFTRVLMLPPAEINKQYFQARPDRLRVGPTGLIAIASK